MMRKLLLSLSALVGAVAAVSSDAPAAQAAPVAFAVTGGPARIQSVQYYEDWRRREWRRREDYERHRRHEEWRRRQGYRHGS